ncbi:hypothetical protein ELQ35_17455 [Peribacillus cavernae]|uniref:MaoC family dehydratase n=1 Tax=Peribacillus cavernae TaxID=1674310 RepID=A0A433HFL6_9BACI|nr:hypothetical protein [Peribacillus cavernae]MDQ0219439.1 hypothetical protein [Peribacillus cavernae]RUQ27137.1 hypothetical protein ELQ35_17455 [Peribacillus cavernae]
MGNVEHFFIGHIARLQRTFTKIDVKRWNVLTKDFNEVYSQDFSKKPNQRAFVPWILSESVISEVISKELAGVATIVIKKELVFTYPVHIGDTITVEVEIIDLNRQMNWIIQRVQCINESGIEVIRGQFILKVI